MKAHISRENMIAFLLTTPIFEDLEPQEISEIIHIVDSQKFAAGETLFHEGDAGDAWYALYSGEIEVLKDSGGNDKHITLLKPQACFGEIAVLDGLPRSATIRAAKDSVVLRIPQDKFNSLIESNNSIAYKLVRLMAVNLATRQRSNTESLSRLLLADELSAVHDGISEIIGDSSVRE